MPFPLFQIILVDAGGHLSIFSFEKGDIICTKQVAEEPILGIVEYPNTTFYAVILKARLRMTNRELLKLLAIAHHGCPSVTRDCSWLAYTNTHTHTHTHTHTVLSRTQLQLRGHSAMAPALCVLRPRGGAPIGLCFMRSA